MGFIFNMFNGSEKVIGATFMTVVTGLIGGWDLSLQVLGIVILIDFATGILKGYRTEGVVSRKIREGIVTKGVYILIIILAYQFDLLLGNEAPIFRTATTWLYILTEAVSILENSYVLGVPIPKKFYEFLMVVKRESGGYLDEDQLGELKDKEIKEK